MKKQSEKYREERKELLRIKKTLSKSCEICKGEGCDLSHILPRSTYPQYKTDPRNLQILCRSCHVKFDDDLSFRSKQIHIINRVKSFDEQAANRYFDL
ncbi:MAG: HNH endonuclease [Phocaeicola sp.]